ncbi:protein SCAR-like [Macrosteles quadrilineatus]|uniref:protein SCAR-like n=1 Tax=Macrosteles quadrilineatus TaxID=74068 RepID=UPI0023E1F54A|nr:protein SCAR-like [Macrosteles quadrilineatus]
MASFGSRRELRDHLRVTHLVSVLSTLDEWAGLSEDEDEDEDTNGARQMLVDNVREESHSASMREEADKTAGPLSGIMSPSSVAATVDNNSKGESVNDVDDDNVDHNSSPDHSIIDLTTPSPTGASSVPSPPPPPPQSHQLWCPWQQQQQQTPTPPQPSPPPPATRFVCPDCGRAFARRFCLRRHMEANCPATTSLKRFQCPECGRQFKTEYSMNRHLRFHCRSKRVKIWGTENSPPPPPPPPPTPPPPTAGPSNQYGGGGSQGISYSPSGSGSGSGSDEPSEIPGNIAPENFEEVETAFRGRLKTYRLRDEAPSRLTIPEFLTQLFEDLVTLMHRILEHVTAVETNLWLDCEFTNVHD